MNYIKLAFWILLFPVFSFAQNYSLFPATNIGPNVMSGRVVDIAINVSNPQEFVVAYATGGLWHTTDNGVEFTCISNTAPTQHMGSIAVHWDSKTIYAGTGEANSSRSSYSGVGVLKSTDWGKTWTNVGLKDTYHIGKILVNPKDKNAIYVAAIGHLYSKNKERGVYVSKNGGSTWKNTLFISDSVGVIDISIVPNQPNVLLASAWERSRSAWNFKEGGTGSAIYKSTDSGQSWSKISTGKNGFPQNKFVGRIGIAAVNHDIYYAYLDNQTSLKSDTKEGNSLQHNDFLNMSASEFLKMDSSTINTYIKQYNMPQKYAVIRKKIENAEISPKDLYKYNVDAQRKLLDAEVKGAELYRTDDGGVTWYKTHNNVLKNVVNTYGYYFGELAVNKNDPNQVIITGVPLLQSNDGGKTFTQIDKENTHGDHQFIWINPNNSKHLINGNDGGVNVSWSGGDSWIKCNSTPVGQIYSINVDNAKEYNVYAGFQDNGVWMAPHTAKMNNRWLQEGHNPYKRLLGGDGMQVQIDNRDNTTIYTGFQFGYYFRFQGEKRTFIRPSHQLGESPLRFNWQTPILLSPHNQDVLYIGSNFLHKSENKGGEFEKISPDLTNGGKIGDVPYGTIASIDESVFEFGQLLVGSDDGKIFIHKKNKWVDISSRLPQDKWVSRVRFSRFKKNRIYATLNGYRTDDFTAYVYMSDDLGKSWKNISSNLPHSPVNVITEDFTDANMLFVGNDKGLYVSENSGKNWQRMSDIPFVAVHDAVIQKEKNHLVVATHGRSIYIIDLNKWKTYTQTKTRISSDKLRLRTPVLSRFGWSRESSSKKGLSVENSSNKVLSCNIKDNKNTQLIDFRVASGQTKNIDFIYKNDSWEVLNQNFDKGNYTLKCGELVTDIQITD